MTSVEFRANETLVNGLKEILDSEIYKIATEIVETEGPLHQEEKGDPLVHYGKILGHAESATQYKELATFAAVKPHPTRTYARKSRE